MADNPGEPLLAALLTKLGPYAPGAAGAVLSMGFGANLTLRAKAVSLAIGLSAAKWLSPVMVALLAWWAPRLAESAVGLMGFACGFLGMALFSGLAQAIAKYAGDPLRLIKFEAGGLRIGGGGED